jgi:hypothetical protein
LLAHEVDGEEGGEPIRLQAGNEIVLAERTRDSDCDRLLYFSFGDVLEVLGAGLEGAGPELDFAELGFVELTVLGGDFAAEFGFEYVRIYLVADLTGEGHEAAYCFGLGCAGSGPREEAGCWAHID